MLVQVELVAQEVQVVAKHRPFNQPHSQQVALWIDFETGNLVQKVDFVDDFGSEFGYLFNLNLVEVSNVVRKVVFDSFLEVENVNFLSVGESENQRSRNLKIDLFAKSLFDFVVTYGLVLPLKETLECGVRVVVGVVRGVIENRNDIKGLIFDKLSDFYFFWFFFFLFESVVVIVVVVASSFVIFLLHDCHIFYNLNYFGLFPLLQEFLVIELERLSLEQVFIVNFIDIRYRVAADELYDVLVDLID